MSTSMQKSLAPVSDTDVMYLLALASETGMRELIFTPVLAIMGPAANGGRMAFTVMEPTSRGSWHTTTWDAAPPHLRVYLAHDPERVGNNLRIEVPHPLGRRSAESLENVTHLRRAAKASDCCVSVLVSAQNAPDNRGCRAGSREDIRHQNRHRRCQR